MARYSWTFPNQLTLDQCEFVGIWTEFGEVRATYVVGSEEDLSLELDCPAGKQAWKYQFDVDECDIPSGVPCYIAFSDVCVVPPYATCYGLLDRDPLNPATTTSTTLCPPPTTTTTTAEPSRCWILDYATGADINGEKLFVSKPQWSSDDGFFTSLPQTQALMDAALSGFISWDGENANYTPRKLVAVTGPDKTERTNIGDSVVLDLYFEETVEGLPPYDYKLSMCATRIDCLLTTPPPDCGLCASLGSTASTGELSQVAGTWTLTAPAEGIYEHDAIDDAIVVRAGDTSIWSIQVGGDEKGFLVSDRCTPEGEYSGEFGTLTLACGGAGTTTVAPTTTTTTSTTTTTIPPIEGSKCDFHEGEPEAWLQYDATVYPFVSRWAFQYNGQSTATITDVTSGLFVTLTDLQTDFLEVTGTGEVTISIAAHAGTDDAFCVVWNESTTTTTTTTIAP